MSEYSFDDEKVITDNEDDVSQIIEETNAKNEGLVVHRSRVGIERASDCNKELIFQVELKLYSIK